VLVGDGKVGERRFSREAFTPTSDQTPYLVRNPHVLFGLDQVDEHALHGRVVGVGHDEITVLHGGLEELKSPHHDFRLRVLKAHVQHLEKVRDHWRVAIEKVDDPEVQLIVLTDEHVARGLVDELCDVHDWQ